MALAASVLSFSAFNSFSSCANLASSVRSLSVFSGDSVNFFFISMYCLWLVFESPKLVIHLDKVQCPIPYFTWNVSIDSPELMYSSMI